ncbi:MAG TPA: sulfite oxidase-like oxidoreductase [Nocardioides sp.]|jgi:DMSO/TMAO reductase YedYZ molybdopterin-dependent catalytic subunit|nr:sulfite oxidase-like oxidoreductase [Nocardioides sp.]
MAAISRGFHRRREQNPALPPGQHLTTDFPVLSAGPTPHIATDEWSFTLTTETGEQRTWTWADLQALPSERPNVDIHCVTSWSKLGTSWRGVSLDVLLADVASSAPYAMAHSYGGYTTNVPVADLTDGKAWVVHEFDGRPLAPVHGGPARLLVPHLYFWKSAKWVRGLQLLDHDRPGFWEGLGYHMYGDPWKEQRYHGQ